MYNISMCFTQTLEKIFTQNNIKQQLSDAKLEEANLRLKEAEEKHQREKEYVSHESFFSFLNSVLANKSIFYV